MGDRRIVALPSLSGPCGLGGIQTVVVLVRHVEIARKVAVVIRTGIGSVIPIQSRVSILSGPEQDGCRGLEIFRRGIIVLKEGDRLEGYPVTRVAHLAVLVTPVGVVHIVPHQVVNLLGRGVLRTPLTGGPESDESEPVAVAPVLLHSQIICERTVVNSLYPIVSTKSGRGADSV